ncbi:MAG: hypothetical protein Q7J57_00500, partial [Gemmobacter sp.]|nr:hypothetical protein [Gemmobacter sp.]
MKYIFSEADIRHSTFHSTGSLSFVRQDPEHLDAKLALQRELADPAERQALLDELQSTIMSDAYWKPLHGPPDFTPVSSSVLDAQMDSRGVIWPELLSMTVLRPCCACLQRGWSVPD